MRVFYSPHQKGHQPDHFVSAGNIKDHPDVPDRLDALLTGAALGHHEIAWPADHGTRYVKLVHSERYLEFLEGAHRQWRSLANASEHVVPNVHPREVRSDHYPHSIVGRAGFHLYDQSCPIAQETWPAILWNAHSATEAALSVSKGLRCAYALCRPPGHHAGSEYAGGFCYLNNAAIAATVLRERFERVAVLDVDVHHGNGTQNIFYARSDVLVVSLHGDPADFYPFYWGYRDEVGVGEGRGYNLNLPLPRGVGDDAYLLELAKGIDRIVAAQSQALVVSLGFDGYELDPLAWLRITTQGFARIGAAVARLDLPVVIVQEGGYFCRDLGRNLAEFLRGFETSGGA